MAHSHSEDDAMAKYEHKGKGRAADGAAGGGRGGGAGAGTTEARSAGGAKGRHGKPQHGKPHRRPHTAAEEVAPAPTLPGLNKLKAAIRQTKRLLARDDLNPETRQEAERKLVALEEDVVAKEAENAAREVGLKNRKLIFFDSVKATRKARTLLKSRAQAVKELEEGETKDAQERFDKIEAQLKHFRLILNYTLHWPPLERYSRFYKTEPDYDPAKPRQPSKHDGGGEDSDDGDEAESDESDDDGSGSEAGDASGPSISNGKKTAKPSGTSGAPSRKHLRRIEFARSHRAWVESAMASGEISAEPEQDASLASSGPHHDNGNAARGTSHAPSKAGRSAGPSSARPLSRPGRAQARPTSAREGHSAKAEQRPQHKAKRRRDDDGGDAEAQSSSRKKSKQTGKPERRKRDKDGAPSSRSAQESAPAGIQDDDFFDI